MPRRLEIILGPTAVGKTGYAIRRALEVGSPVISCDSRQIFKELRIDGVPFHEGVNISSGSTIADISAKAMETLSVGKHTVTFVYVDGEASADFSYRKSCLQPATQDIPRCG